MMDGLRAKLSPSSRPPPPPPKDKIYMQSSFSTVSLNPPHSFASYSPSYASSSHDNLSRIDQFPTRMPVSPTPQSSFSRTLSPVVSLFSINQSPSTPTTPASNNSSNESNTLKRGMKGLNKGFSKISSFSRRPFTPRSNSRPSLSDMRADTPESYSDDSISRPWNFRHHLHADEGLSAVSQEWLASLRSAGLTDEEILAIHIRRQQQREQDQRGQAYSPVPITGLTPYASSSISSMSSLASSNKSLAPPNPLLVSITPPRGDSLNRLSMISDSTAASLPTPTYRIDTTSLPVRHPYAAKTGNSPVSPSEASISTVTDKGSKEEKVNPSPTTPVSQNILYALKSFSPGLGLAPEAEPFNRSSLIASSLENVERATSMLEKAACMADSTADTSNLSVEESDRRRLSGSVSSMSSGGQPHHRRHRPAELSLSSSRHSRTRSDLSLYTPPLLPPPSRPPPSPPHTPDALRDSDASAESSEGVRSPPPTIQITRLSISGDTENVEKNGLTLAGTTPPRLTLPESLDLSLGDWSDSLFSVLKQQPSSKIISNLDTTQDTLLDRSKLRITDIVDPTPSPSDTELSLSIYSSSTTSMNKDADEKAHQLRSEDLSSELTNSEPTPISPDPLPSPYDSNSLHSESATPLSPLFNEVLGMVGQTVPLSSPAQHSIPDASPILPQSAVSRHATDNDEQQDAPEFADQRNSVSISADTAEDAYASTSPRSTEWIDSPIEHDENRLTVLSASLISVVGPPRAPQMSRTPSPHSAQSSYSDSTGSSSRRKSSYATSTPSLLDEVVRPANLPPAVRVHTPKGQTFANAEPEAFKDGLDSPNPGGNLHRSASALVHEWIKDSTASVLAYDQDEDLDDDNMSVYGLDPVAEEDAEAKSSPISQNEGNLNQSSSLRPLPQTLLPTSPTESTPLTPITPPDKYRGWLSQVLAPLEEFLSDADPRSLFADLQEIAEGEHGSVFAARVIKESSSKSNLLEGDMVAIKNMPMTPSGSPKLEQLRRELMLMSRIKHERILAMNSLYVDLVEDALWIQMELMERSLADVLALVSEGLVITENIIGRFIHDTLQALACLEANGIAHRDVRSDNLLVNGSGYLKLADFSNAVHVGSCEPIRSEAVGVIYWQAPEMRRGPYDARKVDVWSVGATLWELAEAEPPFSRLEDIQNIPEALPELSRPDSFSRQFHDFLLMCTLPPDNRPSAQELLQTPYIRSACACSVIVQLLSHCRNIEEDLHIRQSDESQGTIL